MTARWINETMNMRKNMTMVPPKKNTDKIVQKQHTNWNNLAIETLILRLLYIYYRDEERIFWAKQCQTLNYITSYTFYHYLWLTIQLPWHFSASPAENHQPSTIVVRDSQGSAGEAGSGETHHGGYADAGDAVPSVPWVAAVSPRIRRELSIIWLNNVEYININPINRH